MYFTHHACEIIARWHESSRNCTKQIWWTVAGTKPEPSDVALRCIVSGSAAAIISTMTVAYNSQQYHQTEAYIG
jgi:hypothetical protein